MLYPSTVNIFIMRRYAAKGIFKKKTEDKLRKMSWLSVVIYSVFVTLIILCEPSSTPTSVEHAYLRKNVRALMLLTFKLDSVKKQ